MWFHRGSALLLLVAATAGCSRHSGDSSGPATSSGQLREEQRTLPTDPDVSRGTLRNGVKYVLQPFTNTGHATRLVLVVGAGSQDEGEGERGVAHFVEHVAMDSAQRFGELAPSELLARVGSTLDADSNAEAHLSYTEYFLTLRSADSSLLDQGLDALVGWASRVTFTPEVVERQRGIVLAELRASDAQKVGVVGRLNGFLMQGLGIADRGPLGAQEDLQAVAGAQLEAFYRRGYLPQSLTVVASGEFDRESLAQRIESRFGALRSAAEGTRLERTELARRVPAFLPGEKSILGNAKAEPLPGGFATLLLQLPASGVRFEQDYRADLMDHFLCALLEDRLREASQSGRFECTPARPDGGQMQLRLRAWAAPATALRPNVEALLVEFQRSQQHGFLDSELRRAEPRVAEQIAKAARAAPALRESSQELVKYALGEQPLLSASQKQELGKRLFATIDGPALERRTREWLMNGRRVIAAIRAEGDDSLSSEQALDELVHEVEKRPLPPPREPELAVALMPVLPDPGHIVHSERVSGPDLYLWTLGNGAKVVFKRAREGSAQAILRGLLPEHTEEASKEDEKSHWSRLYAPRIVESSGVGLHDAPTLSRLLSIRTTRVHLAADIDASSSIQDFETTLQLLYLYLTAPRRDPQAFEQLRAGMREQPTPPQAFANAMFPESDPRAVAEQLDLDLAMRAYRAQFGNVAGVEFVIVADLEEERLRALVERYLASLPGTPDASAHFANQSAGAREPSSVPALAARRASAGGDRGIRRVRMAHRPGTQSQVVMHFDGSAVPSVQARIELEALEAYLRLRLREVLREQLGGIYDVDVSSGWNENASWQEIRFDCKPGDVEKLRQATLDVIAGIDRPGISDAHLKLLRAQHAAQFPRAFHEDGFWLAELARAYREAAAPRRILELPKLSAHITRDALRVAARRSLPLDHYIDAVWSPGDAGDAR